jgi:phospholipid/cholesterol/gamma-HCH transport system permease protein
MKAFVQALGAIALLGGRTLVGAVRPPFRFAETSRQIETIGYRSVSVVVLMAMFSSAVMTVQFAVQLARFGAKEYVGQVVSLSLVRELGPVLTALIAGGRVGAGIAAELGSMNVTEQIDALRAMGADPVKELVVPRVIAGAITMPLLTMISIVLGVGGAMVVARLDSGVGMSYFLNTTLRTITLSDLIGGLAKTVIFGVAITLIACWKGLSTRGGTEGVGRATTETVVIASITTLIADFVLTKLLLEVGL